MRCLAINEFHCSPNASKYICNTVLQWLLDAFIQRYLLVLCLTTSCRADVHYLKATELKSRVFVTHGTRQSVVRETSDF